MYGKCLTVFCHADVVCLCLVCILWQDHSIVECPQLHPGASAVNLTKVGARDVTHSVEGSISMNRDNV